MKAVTFKQAVIIARDNQPDAEFAAEALEDAGATRDIARRALREVFGYDVLGAKQHRIAIALVDFRRLLNELTRPVPGYEGSHETVRGETVQVPPTDVLDAIIGTFQEAR